MRTAYLPVLLCVLASACTTWAPRIPFRDTSYQASVVGGNWTINQFVDEADALGLQLVMVEAGTGGWAYDFGMRYAKGDGDGQRSVTDPGTGDVTADSKREIDFYEVAFGVRQIYRPDERLQPYFGVGGVMVQARTVERWTQPAVAPDFPADTPLSDHERTEIRPGIYFRTGLVWNVLRDQLREKTEIPIGFDVRGVLSNDYSYLEFALSFGYGR